MSLPTSREIELETLLRQRDAQVAELTDEVVKLRQYLTNQPAAPTTTAITLPPPLVSAILPHLRASSASNSNSNTFNAAGSNSQWSTSGTVTAALTQRIRLLQVENDELYDLLKQGETGKLKEEVKGLRRVVGRLEGALRDSQQVITHLSNEVDKSFESFQLSLRNAHNHAPTPRNAYQHHPSPRAPSVSASNNTNGGRLPPTGPRAHKKPRLSEPQAQISPARSNISLPPSKSQPHMAHVRRGVSVSKDERSRSPRVHQADGGRGKGGREANPNMEIDDDARTRPRSRSPRSSRSPVRGRERERERGGERARERDRDREVDRDRDRFSRRNYHGGGGGGRRGRGFNGHSYANADRTLAERMGL